MNNYFRCWGLAERYSTASSNHRWGVQVGEYQQFRGCVQLDYRVPSREDILRLCKFSSALELSLPVLQLCDSVQLLSGDVIESIVCGKYAPLKVSNLNKDSTVGYYIMSRSEVCAKMFATNTNSNGSDRSSRSQTGAVGPGGRTSQF